MATYHGIERARCIQCTFDATDDAVLETWNDLGGECPACRGRAIEWRMSDGTITITIDDEATGQEMQRLNLKARTRPDPTP